ncbi:MAG: aminotransferase class I/II-fold pyridoxal phosphate-dependent enzyme [Egibacteraceae bacterium]
MTAAPLDPTTQAVSAGRGAGDPGDALSVPVTLASVYRSGGGPGAVGYGREGNPTWTALEDVLAALEGGTAHVFSSGMGAIEAVLDLLPLGAPVAVARDAYIGTRARLDDLAERGRVVVRPVDIADTGATLAACEGASLLWIESPTNPLMAIADLPALARGARELGVRTVADNTFATPLLTRPLDLGVDVVVHSVTKFLAGHSDVLLGATVAADPALAEELRARRTLLGSVPGPMEAWLALRGVRTLGPRLERAQASAGELARRLERHPGVTRVRYPGLPDDPGHARAAAQMRGFGAMLAFEVAGGGPAADGVCANVRLAIHATSLGGVETTLERRNEHPGEEAVPAGLVRVSVGCEHVEDLWADLAQALAAPA